MTLPTQPPAIDEPAPDRPKAITEKEFNGLLDTVLTGHGYPKTYYDWIAGNLNRLLHAWLNHPDANMDDLSRESRLTIYQLEQRFAPALVLLHTGYFND